MAEAGMLAQVLDALADGTISTQQAVRQVRRMDFPAHRPTRLGEDPVPDQPGDGHEIADAYHDGKITNAQYAALAEAAAGRVRG